VWTVENAKHRKTSASPTTKRRGKGLGLQEGLSGGSALSRTGQGLAVCIQKGNRSHSESIQILREGRASRTHVNPSYRTTVPRKESVKRRKAAQKMNLGKNAERMERATN